MVQEELDRRVASLVARTPEWLRHDLASSDRGARTRAEETLSAMILALLNEDTALQASVAQS